MKMPRNIGVVVELLGFLAVSLLTTDFNSVAAQSDYNGESYGSVDLPQPPSPWKKAEMARYVVKVSNWTTVATISTREPTVGFPFSSILSVSDGPKSRSTGVPYMYVTDMDIAPTDIKKDNRATLFMSLAQSEYCTANNLDPEDPRCARVSLSGRIVKIPKHSKEAKFAKWAVFSKHPSMAFWPKDHGFHFVKLEISSILLFDYFGGATILTPEEYFDVTNVETGKLAKKVSKFLL